MCVDYIVRTQRCTSSRIFFHLRIVLFSLGFTSTSSTNKNFTLFKYWNVTVAVLCMPYMWCGCWVRCKLLEMCFWSHLPIHCKLTLCLQTIYVMLLDSLITYAKYLCFFSHSFSFPIQTFYHSFTIPSIPIAQRFNISLFRTLCVK